MAVTTCTNEIKIVIGSWGSYNACNERALGSEWLDLADYENWEEVEEALRRQGFELDGMDGELFIQDIENIPSNAASWDYVDPKTLFETLKETEILDVIGKYETLMAFLEVRSFSDFEELVSRYGCRWDDDIYIYKNYDWEDYGREMFDCFGYKLPDNLEDYFDFKSFGESFKYDGIEEYSDGLIGIGR